MLLITTVGTQSRFFRQELLMREAQSRDMFETFPASRQSFAVKPPGVKIVIASFDS